MISATNTNKVTLVTTFASENLSASKYSDAGDKAKLT